MTAAGSPLLPTPPGPSFWLVQVWPPSSDQPTCVPKIVLTCDPTQSVALCPQKRTTLCRGWTAMEFSVRVRSVAEVMATSGVSDASFFKGMTGPGKLWGAPWIGPYWVWYQTDQTSLRPFFGAGAESAEGANAQRDTTA